MTQVLKQSTAVDVLIGPFVDLTDGATSETGESPSVKLSKNGQALAAKNDVTTPVHDADGYYNCELDATDTDTVGTLILTVAKSANALPVRHEFQVVEEDTYEFLWASGAAPDTDTAAIKTKTDFLPSATAGGSGGVPIVGANTAAISFTAGMTISNAGGSALTLTSSGSNGAGLTASGNGSGAGIAATGGATGQGLNCVGGATSGPGIRATATSGSGFTTTSTSGNGWTATGGGTGHGISAAGGATSGDGIRAALGGSGVDIRGDITGNLSGSVGSLTGHTVQTGDSFARIGVAGAGLTNINLPNQTMDIVGNITGNLSGSVGSVTGAVGSVTGAVGSVSGNVDGNVTGSVGSLAAQAKADVNAEALDVVNTDTITLPGQEAPPGSPTHRQAIAWLYKVFRNRKDQTATLWQLYADNETTVDAKATVSDDGTTAVKQEIVTGP